MMSKNIKRLTIFNIIIISIISVLGIVMLFNPSYARNLANEYYSTWDGETVSTTLSGSGTSSDPYVISNGADLAFFYKNCTNSNWNDRYYVLDNDIYLNEGYFDYIDDGNFKYHLNNKTYYIAKDKYYTTKDDLNSETNGQNIHVLKNRKYDPFYGTFDGNGHAIIGMFFNDSNADSNHFISHNYGVIQNVKFFNSIIISKKNSSLIGDIYESGTTKNIVFNGTIKNYAVGNAGLIGTVVDKGNISNIAMHGRVEGYGNIGGIVGRYVTPNSGLSSILNISNSYNTAEVISDNVAGGIIGKSENTNYLNLTNVFNTGNILGEYSGGVLGYLTSTSVANSINFTNSFSSNADNFIGYIPISATIHASNNYYTNANTKAVGNYSTAVSGIEYKHYMNLFATNNLSSMGYLQYDENQVSSGYIWKYRLYQSPYLYFDDVTKPDVTINYNTNTWTPSNNSRTISIITANSTGNISVSVSDDSDIAKIEYYIKNKYDTTTENIENLDLKLYTDDTTFTVEPNTCQTIYIKATDIYGNSSYAFSDMIFYDAYVLDFSEGINHNSLGIKSNTIFKYFTKNSEINIRGKHSVNTDSYIYNADNKEYMYFYYIPPTGTVMTLYDYTKNKIYKYTVNNTSDFSYNYSGVSLYRLDLSVFKSIYDSSIAYDNTVYGHYDSVKKKIDEDFEISFDFSKCSFPNSYVLKGYIRSYSTTNQTVVMSYRSSIFEFELMTDQEAEYSLEIIPDSTNAIDNISNTISMDLVLTKQLMNTQNSTYTHEDTFIYDPSFFNADYTIVLKVVDENNNVIKSTSGNNISYQIKNGASFNNKTDNNAYMKVNIPARSYSWYNMFGYRGMVSFKIKVLNNRYIDIANGTYQLNVYLQDLSGTTIATAQTPLTVSKAIQINNASYNFAITDKNDRIIEAGETAAGNNYMGFNYTLSLNNPTSSSLLVKTYKIEEVDDEVVKTEVNPSTIFNSTYNFPVLDNYYLLQINHHNLDNVLNIKSDTPSGVYDVEIFFQNNGKIQTSENFNILVK